MDIELPPDFDPRRPTVLCLCSLQFNRDIAELQKYGTRFAWAALMDSFLKEVQERWVPTKLQEQAVYFNETGPDVDAAWAKSKRFALGIFANLMGKGMRITAVMASNWDYWNEECIRLACIDLGIPFLVLLREHYLTDNRWEEAQDYWGQYPPPPGVAGVATVGPATHEILEGMKLFPPAKLRTTGWPRLDAWRRPATPLYDRPIVLMSYFKGYRAEKHAVEMLDVFSALARQYPQVPFVVKAKHDMEVDLLREVARQRNITNLEIMDSLSLPDVLCNARAVIGFQSQAMYEALLSPARLLIPRWGQTDVDWRTLVISPMDSRLKGHMEFIPSQDEFVRIVGECAQSDPAPVDMEARAKLFGEYVTYTPERSAVERIEDFVAEFGLKVPLSMASGTPVAR